jgi:DNA-binding NarL/FixJ family response regulator
MPSANQWIIADNEFLTFVGLKAMLEEQVEFLHAQTAEKFADMAAADAALLLIDPFALQVSAADLAEWRLRCPKLPVLVFTSALPTTELLPYLQQDITGCVFKSCSPDEFTRATKAVGRGEKFFCNRVFDLLVNKPATNAEPDCLPTEITPREQEIIRFIARGNSTAEIADQLNLSPHTISTHRKNILRKLNIKSPVELVAYALKLGLGD